MTYVVDYETPPIVVIKERNEDTNSPRVSKIYYDSECMLPTYTKDLSDYALVPYVFSRFESFYTECVNEEGVWIFTDGWNKGYKWFKGGWLNMKGKAFETKVLVYLIRYQHIYAFYKGYFVIKKTPLLDVAKSITANIHHDFVYDLVKPITLPPVIYFNPPYVAPINNIVLWEGRDYMFDFWLHCEQLFISAKRIAEQAALLDTIKSNTLISRFAYYRFDHISQVKFIYDDLFHIISELKAINLSIGYVKTDNIFDKAHYPIISEAITKFVDKEYWNNLNNLQRSKVYHWVMQILILTIYMHVKHCIRKLEGEHGSKILSAMDLKSQFYVLSLWCHKHLDNSFKKLLIKRNPRIDQEILTGLDTEYVPQNFGKNQLISVQTATSAFIRIFVPTYKDYVFEGVNTLTNETYIISPPNFKFDKFSVVYINLLLKNIRTFTFGHLESALTSLANELATYKEVDTINVDESGCLFLFKKFTIQKDIFLAKDGETLKLNWVNLINHVRNTIDFKGYMTKLVERLVSINYFGASSLNVTPKVGLSWNADTLVSNKLNTIIWSNEMNENVDHSKTERPLPIKFKLSDVNVPLTDISFNINKSIYLYGHYNAADFSMIEGFAEIIRRNVDILKKSYVSLIAPIKTLGESVYVRDTILLSSAAASTLQAVGKAHGLKKITIPKEYLPRMDLLLEERRDLFLLYASQDALITLIHALFMRDFSCQLGCVRNPGTLGSLASKYIKSVWKKDSYRGYQIDINYPLGNAKVSHTPKGIASLGVVGEALNLFLGTFRGGRNECFAYGKDSKTVWFDYDLTSCYASVMSLIGDPIYADGLDVGIGDGVGEESLPPFVPLSDNVHRKKIPSAISSTFVPQDPEGNSLSQEFSSSGVGLPTFLAAPPVPLEEGLGEREGGGLGGGILSSSSVVPEGVSPDFPEDLSDHHAMSRLFPDIASVCGQPDYSKAKWIKNEYELKQLDLSKCFAALRVEFKFPKSVLYPPIPVTLNKDITIYPSSGNSLITGLEYLTAKNILNLALKNVKNEGYSYIKLLHGVYIPFATEVIEEGDSKVETLKYKPFFNVIKELQANRAKWKFLTGKGSAMERIYKDLGNMIYGKVVSGISNKTTFDVRSESMKGMTSSFLTNPIIGSWITGFVRALLAELLFINQELGGKVTAVTTDGFVSDIKDLEVKAIEFLIKHELYEDSFLKKYRDARVSLSSPETPDALEIKTSVKGLAQWTTRGQMSLNSPEICAMTGFQKHLFTLEEIVSVLSATLGKGNRMMFLQNRLTGALDHYKTGSDVSMICSLRVYKTVFDTKRLVVMLDDSQEILFTQPFRDITQAHLFRNLISELKTGIYSHTYTDKNTFVTSNDICVELIKYFVRVCLEFYKFNPTVNEKQDIIEIIRLAKPSYGGERILAIINECLFNKGVIMNKINYYVESAELVDALKNNLENLCSWNKLNSHEFLNLFNNKFSNFLLSPSLALTVFTPGPTPFEQNCIQGIQINKALDTIYSTIAKLDTDSQRIIKMELESKDLMIVQPLWLRTLEGYVDLLELNAKSVATELEILKIKIEVKSITYLDKITDEFIRDFSNFIIFNYFDFVYDFVLTRSNKIVTVIENEIFFLRL